MHLETPLMQKLQKRARQTWRRWITQLFEVESGSFEAARQTHRFTSGNRPRSWQLLKTSSCNLTPQTPFVISSISISYAYKLPIERLRETYVFRVLFALNQFALAEARSDWLNLRRPFDSAPSMAARTLMCVQLESSGSELSSQQQQP